MIHISTRQRKNCFLKICLSCYWIFLIIWIWFAISAAHNRRSENIGPQHSRSTANPVLKDLIIFENNKQRISGSKRISWPPSVNQTGFWPQGIVITIQVHKRIYYLKKLLQSLSRARWINRALLVFSHGSYTKEINDVIRSIHFAPVMQIYFPYSTQLYQKTFPGDSPSDCPRNIDKQKAILMGCTNARNSDMYGHYREANFCQMKHHWWWKANFIFSKIRALNKYQGQVLFLEEDHYVAEDFLHVLWLQQQLLHGKECKFCNQARVLSLGNYNSMFSHRVDAQKVDLMPWLSSQHNMGMSFNRSVWNDLIQCAGTFCSVDDYNWDWSLAHVTRMCLPRLLGQQSKESQFIFGALVLKAPRVFHLGECGFHQANENCQHETENTLQKMEESLGSARKAGTLFPSSLQVENILKQNQFQSNKKNGGWADPRDKELCMSFSNQELSVHDDAKKN